MINLGELLRMWPRAGSPARPYETSHGLVIFGMIAYIERFQTASALCHTSGTYRSHHGYQLRNVA
jgi:hypothetical protein